MNCFIKCNLSLDQRFAVERLIGSAPALISYHKSLSQPNFHGFWVVVQFEIARSATLVRAAHGPRRPDQLVSEQLNVQGMQASPHARTPDYKQADGTVQVHAVTGTMQAAVHARAQALHSVSPKCT
jgi:hypothetical protein